MLEENRDYGTVIIGAGHSGLSLAWELKQRGERAVIFERDSAMHAWKDLRWDNFTLVTPNWMCRLPGYSYQGELPHGFMNREEVYSWLQAYVQLVDAEIHESVEVQSVSRTEVGLSLQTSQGTVRARAVIVATGGTFQLPRFPASAELLPHTIQRLHSLDYRNAAQLAEGAVLVVGSAQSGAQIAEDLMLEGREVHLAVGDAVRTSRFYRGRDVMDWLDLLGRAGMLSGGPLGRQELATSPYVTGRDGGRDINLYKFAEQGMRLYGRLDRVTANTIHFAPTLNRSLRKAEAFNNGFKDMVDTLITAQGLELPDESREAASAELVEPEVLDLDASGVRSVIWATGLRADYSWLSSEVLDGNGHVVHQEGVTVVPGLYYYRASGLLGADAKWFDPTPIDAGQLADHVLRDAAGVQAG
ncbi:NAD(P)-binding domain-containing protein [Psychromicrobium sp. YIM B11713]|uniref:NAD(P)-binding domain-containing protein n=1 Tax=Psychromicrobium sp. YIM B11713 TaxID=3145233 RepID=UPI00374EFEA8